MTDSLPDSDPTIKPRGLWSVIAHSSGPITPEPPVDVDLVESDTETELTLSTTPRSLFELMERAEIGSPHQHADVDDSRLREKEVDSTDATGSIDSDRSNSETVSIEPFFGPVCPDGNLPVFTPKPSTRRIRQSSIALLCGMASILLSGLSIRPEVWMSIPASGLGFFAMIIGYMSLTGARLRQLSTFTKTASQAGMFLGTLGIFLGPLVFARLGRELRESTGHHQTRNHLALIGNGLARFHDQHGAFPVGGTFVQGPSGVSRGQHGWMTFLLPYIGEQRLYEQIDQTKPFDARENRQPMGHDVEAYFAAGGDRTKIGQGFAVSHFAGVGGEIRDDSRLLHSGIFSRDAPVKRADIVDGAANTLIVGELAGNFAPWGDPENWRKIDKGLNKDVNGFGNSAGTGAMFLLGDGNVKMFSNKTDPKLLMKLSTRDGGEEIP